MVEIQDRDRVAIHRDIAASVDAVLRGQPLGTEIRYRRDDGEVEVTYQDDCRRQRRQQPAWSPGE